MYVSTTFRYLFIPFFAVLILAFGTGCGGDDDDDGQQQSASGSGADVSGGSGNAEQSGSGGTTENGDMDSGTADGNLPVVERVPLQGVCTINLPMTAGLTGICRATEAECEGGTFVLDLSGMDMPAGMAPEGFEDFDLSNMPPIDAKQADCEEGLFCCLKDNLCESSDIISFGDFVESASCVEPDSCTNGFEVPFGCPSGQSCCSVINIEAGIASLDAGQQ